MAKKVAMIEMDDELKAKAQEVIKILPDHAAEAMAVIIFVKEIMVKELGIKDINIVSNI